MKRLWILVLCLVMLCSLAACADSAANTESTSEPAGSTTSTAPQLTWEELLAQLEVQDLYALDAGVSHNREDGKPRLFTSLKNNTDTQISGITLAFAAWDAEGKPIYMKGSVGTDAGAHIREVHFPQITVEAGQTWVPASNGGYLVSAEHTDISQIRACVVSYKLENGETWKNPYYNDWRKLIYGQDLAV